MPYKSKREFYDVGYVSEDTGQMQQQILAMDELFMAIEHETYIDNTQEESE